jgi:galactofuranose transport system permease protein
MMKTLKFDKKFLPITVTIVLFVIMFIGASLKYKGFFSLQVFSNLFIDNSFLLISAIGETFVILSGGIDISVGAMIALCAMLSAYLVENLGVNPAVAMPLVILISTLIGAGMGCLIHYFKFQPFVATLTGMFLARGLCYVISVEAITITNPFYTWFSQYQINIGPKAFLSINVVIALIVLLAAFIVAHHTRFGRTVYAIGGNPQSALLMGLPVARTRVWIYALNGFCSGLAGVVYSVYMLSGYGNYLIGFEMDVISSVVIGGTLLTGGVGYVLGTVFGVLIQGIIQNIIMFDGSLNSWWTKIVVGLLTLAFILMQRTLSSTKKTQLSTVRKKQAADAVKSS